MQKKPGETIKETSYMCETGTSQNVVQHYVSLMMMIISITIIIINTIIIIIIIIYAYAFQVVCFPQVFPLNLTHISSHSYVPHVPPI